MKNELLILRVNNATDAYLYNRMIRHVKIFKIIVVIRTSIVLHGAFSNFFNFFFFYFRPNYFYYIVKKKNIKEKNFKG